MLNKPITISLILILIYFVLACVSSLIFPNNSLYSFLLTLTGLFLPVLYTGISQVKTFKVEIPKLNRIKIALYHSIFLFGFCSLIIILMIMNTTLKDSPLFNINQAQAFILLKVFLTMLLAFSTNGLFIYYVLGLGCKLGLRKEH